MVSPIHDPEVISSKPCHIGVHSPSASVEQTKTIFLALVCGWADDM